jgi:hypothetical protein
MNTYRAKQQNVVWPGPLVNGTEVERFLWKGSGNPTVVQRIGAWILGLAYFAFGLTGVAFAVRERADFFAILIPLTIGCGCLLAGIKVFLNGFRKDKPKEHRS